MLLLLLLLLLLLFDVVNAVTFPPFTPIDDKDAADAVKEFVDDVFVNDSVVEAKKFKPPPDVAVVVVNVAADPVVDKHDNVDKEEPDEEPEDDVNDDDC